MVVVKSFVVRLTCVRCCGCQDYTVATLWREFSRLCEHSPKERIGREGKTTQWKEGKGMQRKG